VRESAAERLAVGHAGSRGGWEPGAVGLDLLAPSAERDGRTTRHREPDRSLLGPRISLPDQLGTAVDRWNTVTTKVEQWHGVVLRLRRPNGFRGGD